MLGQAACTPARPPPCLTSGQWRGAVWMLTLSARACVPRQVLGVHDVIGFEFIDPPSTASISDALRHLYMLGALDEDGGLGAAWCGAPCVSSVIPTPPHPHFSSIPPPPLRPL